MRRTGTDDENESLAPWRDRRRAVALGSPSLVKRSPSQRSVVLPTWAMQIEWESVRERLEDVRGSIRVKCGELTELLIDVEGAFPPSDSGNLTSPTSRWTGTLERTVEVELYEGDGAPGRLAATELQNRRLVDEMKDLRLTFAATSARHTSSRVSSDVCFRFPRTGHVLWANESLLSSASPYLKDLLSSSFVEGTASTSSTQSMVKIDDYVFEESDDETDKIEAKTLSTHSKPSDEPFKTINVTDTAYTTYFSALVYIQSRYISFAPLLSLSRTPGKTHDDSLAAHSVEVSRLRAPADPLLPPPTSPKSIYRLAHLLDLPTLASLAPDNLRSQLTPHIAAYELFSNVATYYPAVRDVVLDFVDEKWDEVKGAEGMREMKERALAGELDAAAAGTALLLAEKLAERMAKA